MSERAPKIDAIYICSDAGLPMESRHEVHAIKGRGLEGDRYATDKGAFSKKKNKIRQVSLIAGEDIAEANAQRSAAEQFTQEDTRRNIVTTGIDLNDLIGKTFQIGTATLKGTGSCSPCARPSELTGKSGFKTAFEDKGGIRAEVLSDGKITIGDEIQVFRTNAADL